MEPVRKLETTPKHSADVILPPARTRYLPGEWLPLVAIGTSTGGTQALDKLLRVLPADVPGIVVVQHMPAQFTGTFAERLNAVAAIEVREARSGDKLRPGLALIAPGGRHLVVNRSGNHYVAEVLDGPPVNRHRPSVDVLFRSVAQCAGPSATGIIMTGMGDDGAQGMLEMSRAGARTYAQDEASCVVFGMPKVAIGLGAVSQVLPLHRLHEAVVAAAARHR